MDARDIARFRTLVKNHYRRYARSFPWRETRNPYEITVSEIMLQQTGTERVAKKYPPFITAFPSFESLASACRRDVLVLWQGLGYNRRAKALGDLAVKVCADFGGVLPRERERLLELPGVGPGTAGSLAAFAYNEPSVFIETNIRRVFLHFFFADREKVRDSEIFPFVEAALDTKNPREWYYALMDYGVHLKSLFPNANKRSAHYSRQSRFENSHRQVRGKIVKILSEGGKERCLSVKELARLTGFEEDRVRKASEDLAAEGMITSLKGDTYGI